MTRREHDLAYASRPQRGVLEPSTVDHAPRAPTATRDPQPHRASPGNGAQAAAARDAHPTARNAAPPTADGSLLPEVWERFSGIADHGLIAQAPARDGGGTTIIMPPERITPSAVAPDSAPASPRALAAPSPLRIDPALATPAERITSSMPADAAGPTPAPHIAPSTTRAASARKTPAPSVALSTMQPRSARTRPLPHAQPVRAAPLGNGARAAAARDAGLARDASARFSGIAGARSLTADAQLTRGSRATDAMPRDPAAAPTQVTRAVGPPTEVALAAQRGAAVDTAQTAPDAWERFSGIVGEGGLVAYAPPSEGGGMTLIMPPVQVRAPAPARERSGPPEKPALAEGDGLDPGRATTQAAGTTDVAAATEDKPHPGAGHTPPEEEPVQAATDETGGEGAKQPSTHEAPGAIDAPAIVGGAAATDTTSTQGDAADGSIAAWSSRVKGSVAAIPHPELASHVAHVEAIGRAGHAATARWKKKVEDIPKEAKKVLEAKPIAPLSEIPPMPSPDPVPEATARVRSKSSHSLPDQRLPDLQNTPHGFKPTVGGLPIDTKAPPAPEPPATAPAKTSKTPVKGVNQTLAKKLEAAPVAGQGQTLTGSDRPPVHAIAAPHRADLARVLARVFDEASQTAALVIHDARARAYTDLDLANVRGLENFGDDQLPAETTWFRDEMTRVAEAAQIGKQALEDAVAARHKELADSKDTAALALAAESQSQQDQVGKSAGDARATIKAMRRSWDEHFDRIAADAKGGVDPKAVREEEDRLDDILRKHATEHVTAWAGMRKERQKKLDRALEDQILAYRDAALADESEQVQASVTQLADPVLTTWFMDRRREISHRMGVLKEEVQNWTDGWQAEMQVARDEAIELVRAWADQRIGRERNWLDQLLARVFAALETKHEETAALADTQTEETVTALGQDLQVLNDLKLKGLEGLDRNEKEHLGKQDEEQQKLLDAYFTSTGADKGDTVLYLARMMQLRLRRQRAPEAIKTIRAKVLQLDNLTYWSELESIGHSQNRSFSAQRSADMLWQAFEHTWGTDEDKAYAAVQGFTAEQGKAVRGVYKNDHDEDLDKRLGSEMSDEEKDRVYYGLEGKQVEADAAALRDAVEGAGTDEDLINRVLRNKTAAERIAIAEAYKSQYGEDLTERLHDELSGDEKAITDAHLEGKTAKADAIEIKMARGAFWGPDQDKIAEVYTRVREEATQYGDARNWKSAEIDVEIAKRTGDIQIEYKATTKRELLTDLEQAFSPPAGVYSSPDQREAADQYWKGRRDLVLGLATGDLTRADAGKIQIERTGIYAKDDTINSVLALQYDRAYDREKRDAMVDFAEANPGRKPTKEEQATIEASVKTRAEAAGKRNMAALGLYFETNYTGGKQSFKETIRDLTSGVDEEKADALIDQGGRLEDWQVLEFATKDDGTDEDAFQKLLKSKKTKAEINALEEEWQAHGHAGKTIKSLIDNETSGRLQNDLLLDYEFGGEPEDPHVVVAKAKKQLEFERESGGEQTFQDMAGRTVTVKNHEYQVLEKRLARLQQDAADYEAAKKLPDTDPNKARAMAWASSKWENSAEGFKSAIETHRFMVDQRTEIVSQVVSMAVAIVVGVVLTVATGGAGTPAAIALIAGVSSLFGAAAGIATKMSMKGKAYGADELGTDIALGVVDAVVSAATAGFGGKLLKSAKTAAKLGGAGAKGLMATLGRMAEGNVVQRAAAHFITEGAEGFLQSLPTAILGTALNEQTWEQGNPFLNMLMGVGTGVGMGTFASGTIGALTNLKKAPHGALPHEPHVPPKSALIEMHDNPGKLADIEARYFEANPTHTRADFRHNYDGALLKIAEHDPEFAARLHSQLRDEITELVPPQHRELLGDSPVEMWDAKRFEEYTGSQSGQAVVIIKDGHPTVIVKQGADRQALAQEGFHLLQAIDPKTRSKVARLDEATLSRWSTMDPREKLQLYREKLDLELDAQRQLIDALESRAGGGVDDAFVDRLASEKATLENLEHRLGEIERISPLQRTLMAWGLVYEPQWLDQPARLFAKPRLPSLRAKVLTEAHLASIPGTDLKKPIETLIDKLPARQQRAMLVHLEAAFAEIRLPKGVRRFEAEKIEGLLASATKLLDPKQTRLGRTLTAEMRADLVARAFSHSDFQGAKNILDGAVSLVTEATDRSRRDSARRILSEILAEPSLDASRMLRASTALFRNPDLRPSTIDLIVGRLLGAKRGAGGIAGVLDSLEGLSRWAHEVGEKRITPPAGIDRDLRRLVQTGDARAAMVAEIERIASATAGTPITLRPVAIEKVGMHGLIETLGQQGHFGIMLLNDIADLEARKVLSGLHDFAAYVFHEYPRPRSEEFKDVINELVEARRIARSLAPGDTIVIGGDRNSGGDRSFDFKATIGGKDVHIEVQTVRGTISGAGALHGPVSHLVDEKMTKLLNASKLPGGAFEATAVVKFPEAVIPASGISGVISRGNGHADVYRSGTKLTSIDTVDAYVKKLLNPNYSKYHRMSAVNIIDTNGTLLARIENRAGTFQITYRHP